MQTVEGNAPPEITDSETVSLPSNQSIGTRTLTINMLTSGSSMSGMEFGAVDLNFGPGADFGGVLTFNADSGVTGTYEAVWSGATVVDLVNGGQGTATGLYLLAGVDANGDTATIGINSGANSSTANIIFPQTNQGRPEQFVFVPFTDFVGTADINQIDEVTLTIGGSQPVDGNIAILGTLEPKVVDFANEPFNPDIDIEKLTNGVDADLAADGPRLAVGSTVTWTYRVTNTGNDNLNQVTVSDNLIGAVTNLVDRENSNNNAILEPGEVWIYEATGTAQLGDYQNTGTVTASDSASGSVNDQDLSHYFGVDVMIDIQKSTNSQDADTVPGPKHRGR